MVVHPATDSPDAGGAIRFAKREYRALAAGPRPASYTVPYQGVQDLLLCKFELGVLPQHDLVRIINSRRVHTHEASGGLVLGGSAVTAGLSPQKITIVSDFWDDITVDDTPFYATTEHHPSEVEGQLLGTLYGTGGTSGNPVVLTSSNTSVAIIENNYRIRIIGAGFVYFTLSQAGNSRFFPAPSLVGGTHYFPLRRTYTASGGMVLGGASSVTTVKVALGKGGLVFGGRANVTRLNNAIPLPIAQPLNVTIPYDNRVGYQVPLTATPGRPGSAISYRVVAKGANCTVTDSGLFSALGTWYGQTSFDYVAVETLNGAVATSAAVRVNVTVSAPLPLPTADSFAVETAFETRNSFGVNLRGHSARGGVLSYNIMGYGAHITLTPDGFNHWLLSFEGTWSGATYIDYTVTETANGVAKTSALARVDITVRPPVAPAANFTISGSADLWIPGTPITFTSTTPAMPDGTALTLTWDLYRQPGPHIVYPTSFNGQTTVVTPVDIGAYTMKLTVTTVYGGTSTATIGFSVISEIPRPTASSFPYSLTYKNRISGFIPVFNNVKAVRGGVLTLTVVAKGPNTGTVDILNADTTYYQKGAYFTCTPADTWYGTTWFTYKVTETKDGIAIDSAVATVTVQVAAPEPLSVKSVDTSSSSTAYIYLNGGSGRYTVKLLGKYTLSGWTPPSPWTVTTTIISVPRTGWCSDGAYLSITDSFGATVTVLASTLGIATCVTKTWKWKLVWTSPAGDIRDYAYFKSYMTLDQYCNWINPVNIAQISYESNTYAPTSDKWKVVGNHFNRYSYSLPSTYFWASLEKMIDPYATGRPSNYSVLPVSFVNYFTTNCYNYFYVHQVYKWVYE